MKPIRVALSGSGFRLPAHCGALSAIVAAGYQIKELAGTSGGSICAALFAAGMAPAQMTEVALNFDWSPMLTFDPWNGLRRHGYCSGDKLLAFLLEKTGGKRFRDLDIDLKIISSDLMTEQQVIFSKTTTPDMQIALAARASASIPFVYAPVSYDNMLLVDGGTSNNLPADELVVDDVPRLGIYLVSKDVPVKKRLDLFSMAGRVIDLMLASSEGAHIEEAVKSGAQIVRVPTGFANSLDRNMPKSVRLELFNEGQAAALNALRGRSVTEAP